MNTDDMVKKYFNDFCEEYFYDKNDNSNNVYSIYNFTDFIQLNIEDEFRIPYLNHFINEFSAKDDSIFTGNLHEISVLTDENTQEFLGNRVHFYHGDNLCESFYAIINFEDYPSFFEKIDSLPENAELEVQGRLELNTEYGEDFYYLELHDVKYINLDGENIL